MILGYHQGRLVRYLQNNFSVEFLVDGKRLKLRTFMSTLQFQFFLFVPVLIIGATQDCGSTSLALATAVLTPFFWRFFELERAGQLLLSILSILSDQDYLGCVLHVWCIPHHQWIRQVWVTVCVCVFVCVYRAVLQKPVKDCSPSCCVLKMLPWRYVLRKKKNRVV